ncbi:MAG: hypothetical protein ACJ71N_00940 [Terriglobales bacterium]|jgi:hypothetical protein
MSNLEKFVAAGIVKADTVTEQEKALIERLTPEEQSAMLRIHGAGPSIQRANSSGNIVF